MNSKEQSGSSASPRSELATDEVFCLVNTCLPYISVLRLAKPGFAEMLVKVISPAPNVEVYTMMLPPFMSIGYMSNRVVIPVRDGPVC